MSCYHKCCVQLTKHPRGMDVLLSHHSHGLCQRPFTSQAAMLPELGVKSFRWTTFLLASIHSFSTQCLPPFLVFLDFFS